MSSYVKLLHRVTGMGTGIVMPSLATNVFITVFIYHTEILTKVYDCHRPKTTTAMDQRLRQLLATAALLQQTEGLGLAGCWLPAVLRMLGGGLGIVLVTKPLIQTAAR